MKKSTLIDFQKYLKDKSTINNEDSFISFKLNDDENNFIIKLSKISKIGKVDFISNIGVCKNYFLGIVNIDNSIFSLITLNHILYPKRKIKLYNEVIVLKTNLDIALNCFSVKNIISLDMLVSMPVKGKEDFIKEEYIHKNNGEIYKEIDVEEIENFDDFKNVFKGF